MTSREKFEAWFSGQYPWEPMEDILLKVGPEKERYYLKLIQSSWEAWQASREALDIKLPEVCAFNLCELLDKKQVIEAIRAAGIKVKGE